MSTQSTALVKQVKTIEEVMMDRSSIERFKAGIGELERFLTAEKLARVALTAVLQNSDLLECDPRTILAATLQLGQIGLLPDGFLGQAYLIPFDNTVNGHKVKQATPMVGYRGFGELISRSGKANSHDAQVVFANDQFDFAMGSDPFLRHIRKLGQRGEPIGSYSIVYMKEGPARFDIMDMDELKKIRANARGSSSSKSPWNTWWEEMARKSPLRRLAKYVPLSPEFQRASTIDEGTEFGYSKFDEKRGEYVLETPNHKEEKPPVLQPQRMQGPIIVGEKSKITPCSVCGEPAEVHSDGNVMHVASGEYDHKATLNTGAAAAQAPQGEISGEESAAAPTSDPAADANPFVKDETAAPAGQKELTYEMLPEAQKPDSYHKDQNPQGQHISISQHNRLWAILHASQEKCKASGNKGVTDDEFLAKVRAAGFQDARFLPKSPKTVYDEFCALAGGESLKVSNGH